MLQKFLKKFILKILNLPIFKCIPDRIFLKAKFYLKVGYRLNLKNPLTFNEKIQWLKLYDRNPQYTSLCDKILVREYIKSIIGDEFLIPLYAVYSSFNDIKVENLPDSFVLKVNHDSGGVFICQDKNVDNIKKGLIKIKKALKRNFYYRGREYPYKNITPKILCEQNLTPIGESRINDYKFICFNGKVKSIFVASNRESKNGPYIDFYSLNWEYLDFSRYYRRSGYKIDKPVNFEKMIEISEKLTDGIPLCRVDFYEVNQKLYIGELTLYPGSGFEAFNPNETDILFGSWIDLRKIEDNAH